MKAVSKDPTKTIKALNPTQITKGTGRQTSVVHLSISGQLVKDSDETKMFKAYN